MSRTFSPAPSHDVPPRNRFPLLDVLRGVALVAMAIYHFTWDLELFGYLAPATATTGALKWFARAIAASFLLIAGFSLVLAATPTLEWRGFLLRLAKLVAAAAAITAATLYAFPDSVITFGILHHIAFASLVGLAFLRAPVALVWLAAVLAFMLPQSGLETHADWIAFLGLDPSPPPSNDFVPVFPWLGWSLAGMALARLWQALRRDTAPTLHGPLSRGLMWLGRRSLAVYLVHQPVLIAGIWLVSQAFPPAKPDAAAIFGMQCRAACGQSFDANACDVYCACVSQRLTDMGVSLSETDASDASVQSVIQTCTAAMTATP
ncbi:MAG: DUF1624 domain-containing protein [Rhizobiaceae bacterium]|jgi:uncharacterized membrane protein|nr:DUF1624 domain-containing protein [Rhizobiaceae bacterium]